MSWTQVLAAWGMEMGLSAPVAGTLGVVVVFGAPVLIMVLALAGMEAWAARLRRTSERDR